MEFGSEPHFGIDDSVGGKILSAFPCYPLNAVARLHDRDGVSEGFEVEREIFAVGALHHPLDEGFGFGGGQVAVAQLIGQLNDCFRSESAVEMIVKQDLGCSLDAVERGSADIKSRHRSEV